MGTRALIKILDDQNEVIACIYSKWDGYPSGLGANILEILNDGKSKLVNGYNSHKSPEYFNGMGCLSAYLISQLKEGIGSIYLFPPKSLDVGEDFIYNIYQLKNEIHMQVYDPYEQKILHEGPISELNFRECGL